MFQLSCWSMMSNQAVTLARRWGRKCSCRAPWPLWACLHVLTSVLLWPPHQCHLSTQVNSLVQAFVTHMQCRDYSAGISAANPAGNTWDLFSQSAHLASLRQAAQEAAEEPRCCSGAAERSSNTVLRVWHGVLARWAAGNCQGCSQAFCKWRESKEALHIS